MSKRERCTFWTKEEVTMLLADYLMVGMILSISIFSMGILIVLNKKNRDEKISG